MNKRDMKEELAKWLLDISKYVLTAVILSATFNEMQVTWLYVVAGLIVVSTFVGGIILLRNNKERS
jgi:hypothetical protein